ncbi:hypothetical protein ACJMK2_011114 [Sinanodonta woodiana]|uniref:TLC domain-containing protein n=1 Tax=Sinanodonta woodiana TaxID=1069815 RepID=A0ABD3V715_SINWO
MATGSFQNMSEAQDPQIYTGSDAVELKYGYLAMISSYIFFQILNVIVYLIGPPKVVSKVSEDRWRNLFISWFHALICGTWDILCFILYPEMLDDLIIFINYPTYLVVGISTGYFVYDLIDIILHKRFFMNWEVSLHHLAVISMFWYNLHMRMCIGYNVVALLAEVNSFFLHSRKLLQMMNVGFNHWFYKLVALLNLVTFAFCRGWSLSRITFGMWIEGFRVPTVYFRTLMGSMFIMNGINPVLFWRLLKSDFLRSLEKKKLKVNGNNNVAENHLKSN